MFNESAVQFHCRNTRLVGILHNPDKSSSATGVLILVGGPQYRVGSHRQFVLLARYLAKKGIPVLRYDYRGMGDSDGDFKGFENTEDDIAAAIDFFFHTQNELRSLVICGLCDAATSASFYAEKESRIKGLVLMNPWVRSEAGIARSYLKHYYIKKFMDVETWKKVLKGQISFPESMRSLLNKIHSAISLSEKSNNDITDEKDITHHQLATEQKETTSLADRVFIGLKNFNGKVLLILSGNDLTAAEFNDTINRSKAFRRVVNSPQITRFDIDEADHTFSRMVWKRQVEQRIFEWLCNLD